MCFEGGWNCSAGTVSDQKARCDTETVLFPGVTIRDFAARVPEFLTMSVDY